MIGSLIQEKSRRKRLRLLVNPAAGRGRSVRRFESLARRLDEEKVHYDHHFSKGPGHLTELAEKLSAEAQDHSLIVICGGDGSVNEVLNGLPTPSPPLGLLPCGTGDDLARNLGIPRSIEGACRTLLTGSVRVIDLVSTGSRLYAGIGGGEVDSEVTRRANESRLPFPGSTVYVWAALRTLTSFRPFSFTVTADEWQYRGPVMFVAVANTPSYGGGLRLSPDSLMDDGLIEVCIVEEMGRLELLKCLPRLLRGTHLTHPRVRLLKARRLRLESERPVAFYADGEYHQALPVELSVVPGALRVIVPTTPAGDGGGGRKGSGRPGETG
jgi:YegS/Rv2252/BmrU family lipid kinase